MAKVEAKDGLLFVLKEGKRVVMYDEFGEAVDAYVASMEKGEPVLNVIDVSGDQWETRAPTMKEVLQKKLVLEGGK